MLTARSPALLHRPNLPKKPRLWLGLASLALLQLLPAADSVAQDLHGQVCSAAVELMLEASESAAPRSPAVDELRALLPQLDSQLQPTMQRLINSMDSLFATLRSRQALSPQQHRDFNDALLDTLLQLQPSPATPSTPLADLPERLDFALLLYVSWSQIGRLRPALEHRDSYLSLVISPLAKGIERDLLRDDWLPGSTPEQQSLLKDARTRWKYIAKLLHRGNTEPAPLNVKTQIDRIREDLLQLRQQRDA